ncbi:copper chaperone PCu(A)C [Mycolicibacterium neoaurum]|uniref:copper chaperone PCu(A)C n=1 Tax=Mycolicibacterium neoaurum TaxID=1795 RepID=UPI00248B109C|nr:copper chaperone PCu(A)C [Mycolicibacterium neoaurum]WBP94969.1 copper chaperone PCu(A)C [Mycolicibacterium neoaurum]WBS08733.1 copper chaperone PCu(A)C [Mycolicibacterium neoaurum]
MPKVLILAATLLLAACGSPAAQESPMAERVTVTDQWAAGTDGGMAALFGTLSNTGSNEVRITSGSSPAAGMVELHEVTGAAGSKTMRPKAGGFVIAPGGSHELAPGGDHVMLMDLTGPLSPGSDVTVTLEFEDGSTLPVTAQVRDFAGANEQYQPGHGSHG